MATSEPPADAGAATLVTGGAGDRGRVQRGSMAGILEVAARAGVSPATVSRALRGFPGVSESKRSAVSRAAHELGYVASHSAAALARGRTNTIGLLSPWVSRWYFGTLIEGIQEVVDGHGYDLLLYPLGPAASPLAPRALSKRVDGVIAVNLPQDMTGHSGGRGPAVVTIGSLVDGLPGVHVDDVEVGRLGTEHLLGLGHRRIAFLGLDPSEEYGYRVAHDRHLGYVSALARAGVTPDPALTRTTGWLVSGGEVAWRELSAELAGTDRMPTAVVAVSDEVAMGVVHVAAELGLRVPEELSVIGVDDHDLAAAFNLTTVAQPVREQGRVAAAMLLDRLQGEGPADGAEQVAALPVEVVRRRTTAPPPA